MYLLQDVKELHSYNKGPLILFHINIYMSDWFSEYSKSFPENW